jgi:hypothetical protein
VLLVRTIYYVTYRLNRESDGMGYIEAEEAIALAEALRENTDSAVTTLE